MGEATPRQHLLAALRRLRCDFVLDRAGASDYDIALGVLDTRARDCDGQGVSGAHLIVDGDEPAVVYSDGVRCALDVDAGAVTTCARAYAYDLPAGRHAVGWELDDESIAGPEVIVEPRGFILIPFIRP